MEYFWKWNISEKSGIGIPKGQLKIAQGKSA